MADERKYVLCLLDLLSHSTGALNDPKMKIIIWWVLHCPANSSSPICINSTARSHLHWTRILGKLWWILFLFVSAFEMLYARCHPSEISRLVFKVMTRRCLFISTDIFQTERVHSPTFGSSLIYGKIRKICDWQWLFNYTWI